ncbi:hypothetical protein [Roseovarius nanhaiticus]|uniref:hypothetical protein n=1 Tax=Roseovarius nanhaiticus TaxID=573024 RepID=UPI0024908334|nr:hypothetical protein [Roseovarius nanhaiticus]
MTRPSIKTTLPFDLLLGPDYDVHRGVLEAFPGYVLSSNESRAEGVVYVGDKEFSVQITLRKLSSDIDKRLLVHVWNSLGANGKDIEAAQDSVTVKASGFLESMGYDINPQNLDRVRDSANRIARSDISIVTADADGLAEETWINCFLDLSVMSVEDTSRLDMVIVGSFSDIIYCGLAPYRKHSVH